MNSMNRRDLCVTLTSFAALAVASSQGQTPTQAQDRMAVPAPSGAPGERVLSTQRTFPFGDLPVVKNANGETRAVIRGTLPTGELVELHETTLLPGHAPHPPHQHRHSELMMVREGTIEFNNNGTLERAGPGGVFFAASNVMHGLTNVGETMANYFVIAIGRDNVGVTPV
jgi:quercetin dioxygenase-like cupin family protein